MDKQTVKVLAISFWEWATYIIKAKQSLFNKEQFHIVNEMNRSVVVDKDRLWDMFIDYLTKLKDEVKQICPKCKWELDVEVNKGNVKCPKCGTIFSINKLK